MRIVHNMVAGLALANGLSAAEVALRFDQSLPWFTVGWCAVAACYALALALRPRNPPP